MKNFEAWNNFALSGSVFDYLKFKNEEQKEKDKNTQENEDKNRRTDFKTTEYR